MLNVVADYTRSPLGTWHVEVTVGERPFRETDGADIHEAFLKALDLFEQAFRANGGQGCATIHTPQRRPGRLRGPRRGAPAPGARVPRHQRNLLDRAVRARRAVSTDAFRLQVQFSMGAVRRASRLHRCWSLAVLAPLQRLFSGLPMAPSRLD